MCPGTPDLGWCKHKLAVELHKDTSQEPPETPRGYKGKSAATGDAPSDPELEEMARLYGHYVPGDPGPIQDGRALDEQIKDLFWADTRLMKGEGEMKVTTVSASVRFSKALGDGVHKTVELSAAAALQGQETRAEAQANLYQQLGQQLKTLWDNGKSALDAPQSPERAAISAHYCEMSTG